MTVLLDPHSPTPQPPRLAFAVPRKVGTAVVRNRLRRQVRAHLQQRAGAGTFPAGDWLIALHPGAASVDRAALLGDVDTCIDRSVA